MSTARLLDIGRWRALLGLLWSAGRGRALFFGTLVLVVGVLPTVAMVLLERCAKALSVQTAALGAAYTLEVHHTVARVSLGTPGVARLEDPAFADELQAVQDEEAPTPGAAPGSCWSPSATCASPSSPCA